jgi:hypothetical protein
MSFQWELPKPKFILPQKQKSDFIKEFQAVGKNFEGTISRRAPEGKESSPPIEIQLIGPLRLLTVERGDWVWLTSNISWAANDDNTRIVFSILRNSYDGEVIYSVADAQSQGEFASTTLIGVDLYPLIGGRAPVYFVKAQMYFGGVTFPATSSKTSDIETTGTNAINIPNLILTAAVIDKNVFPTGRLNQVPPL